MERDDRRPRALTFQKTQETEYLRLCVERARTIYLEWVEQALDILEEMGEGRDAATLNDLGCNVGQFWKGLARRGLALDYRGLDIEEVYLGEARKLFPEVADRFEWHDLVAAEPPSADISVTSATLEHLPALSPGFDHLLQSTKRLAVIRTFLGDQALSQLRHKPGAEAPYVINQYAFADVFERCERHGFDARVVRDRHTDSLPVWLTAGIVRTQYFLVARRR